MSLARRGALGSIDLIGHRPGLDGSGRIAVLVDGCRSSSAPRSHAFSPDVGGGGHRPRPPKHDPTHLADEIAAAATAAVHGRIGTTTVEFGTLTTWLIDVIAILTGNLDEPGGSMFPHSAVERVRPNRKGRPYRVGRWSSRVNGNP